MRGASLVGDIPIRIVLIDDQQLVREGIRALLQSDPALSICGEGANSTDALRLVWQLLPDVVLMEINLLGSISAIARLRSAQRVTKVVGLSSCSDPVVIRRFLEAGASAFVSKNASFHALRGVIYSVRQNKLARIVQSPVTPVLSGRERQTLRLVAEGMSSKEIARTLGVCIKTVELHRHNVSRKVGRSGVADLTRYAVKSGLVSPEG